MGKAIVVGLCAMLSACSLNSNADLQKTVDQHSIVLTGMINYFGQLQEQGYLPKPTPAPEEKK